MLRHSSCISFFKIFKSDSSTFHCPLCFLVIYYSQGKIQNGARWNVYMYVPQHTLPSTIYFLNQLWRGIKRSVGVFTAESVELIQVKINAKVSRYNIHFSLLATFLHSHPPPMKALVTNFIYFFTNPTTQITSHYFIQQIINVEMSRE